MIKKVSLFLSSLLIYSGQLFASDNLKAACPTLAMSGSSVSCSGGSNGSAQVAISSGSGNYTINWSNGVTTTTNPGLSVGTYTVTVKDNVSGCSVVGAYVVGSPDPITMSGIVTNVDCFGANTGDVDITVNGGTLPYSYVWKNSANVTVGTSQDLLNVIDGTYTITVTDFKGCTFTQSFTITEPAEALNSSAVITNANCFGSSTGAINVDVWGGTPAYTYSWTSGQSTQDISSQTSGNYTLTIVDANGCSRVQTYSITQPAQLAGTPSTTAVICHGQATGSASISMSGGTTPYTYSWSNSTTLYSVNSNLLNNVVADNYLVNVIDAKGCVYSQIMTISQPTALVGSLTHTNVSCNGGNDGSVDLTISGGIFPYSYSWTNQLSTVVSTSQDLSNIVAGTYTVVVTDANGCTITFTQVITEPLLPIDVTSVVTDVLCFGNSTGSIDLTVTGGTAPFNYSWSSGQTSEDISNLIAGLYAFTVIDNNGCSFTGNALVTQPAMALTVTNTIQDVNCFGESNGNIDLTVTGGTSPYTYDWTNSTYLLSATSQDLNGFPADWYRFEVIDAHGCSVIDTLTITQPTQLTTSISGVNILCFGGNNGSIDLTIGGGVTPYTYAWNNGYTSEDLSNLIAGTYSVVVLDNHNCQITNQITLTQPLDSLSFTFTEKDVLCNDGADGEIEITVAGGTVPYSYNWSNGGVTPLIGDLTSGMYSFLVTDFNGCLLGDSIFVDQPDALTLNEVITPVTCNGLSDGIIDISPIGGTSPYQFTWYNSMFALSAQTEDMINYPADIYQVEIIDSNNCFYEMFFEIVQPDTLKIEYTYTVVSCKDGSDGNIFVNITGGNPGYTTVWSNGATSEDLLNIPANVYELIVTDTKNCMDSISTTIAEPDSVKMNFTFEEVTCIDQHDGVAYVYPYGGNGGYYYNWSNGEVTSVNDGLSNQWYSITITDILGCTGTDSVFITKNNDDCVDPVNAFSPNDDNYNDEWFIRNMELYPEAEMQIFNRWGNLIHHQTGVYTPWDGLINGAEAPSDTYYYILNLNHPERDILTGNITIVR